MKIVCPRDPDGDDVCSHCAWYLAFTPGAVEPEPGQCALPLLVPASMLARALGEQAEEPSEAVEPVQPSERVL